MPKSNAIYPKKRWFVLYLSPAILIYCFTVLVPIGLAAFYGLFNWKGGAKKTYIGLENYLRVLNDATFWQSFYNNIYIIVVCLIGQIGIAFLFAMLLNSRGIRLKGLHRTMSYFPVTLSAVVIGFVWSMIYDYNYGLLNNLLRLAGLTQYVQPWLNNTSIVLFLTCVPLVWQYIGYYMVILLSSFASIDPQIFEMAEIDGANGFQRALRIALPLMKNTILVCVTLCISGNMKIFDHIYSMTNGGPGTSTSVLAMYAYKTSFVKYKMGYGSAMSLWILAVSLIIIGGSRFLLNRAMGDKEA